MIKIENTEVMGWEAAIRGMRNPMNSWEKSDSGWSSDWPYTLNGEGHIFVDSDLEEYMELVIGPNDQKLMKSLRNAGTDHRKFMRMITVYCDITAPLYFWKEHDQYKVGTVTNSCSTMHKIADKEFTLEDFSCEHLIGSPIPNFKKPAHVTEVADNRNKSYSFGLDATPNDFMHWTIEILNTYRELYLKTNDKDYWWQMIQLLPSSYNQKRTTLLNYEVLANMYKSRKNHKLDEWKDFCKWIETLPYSELITGDFDEK